MFINAGDSQPRNSQQTRLVKSWVVETLQLDEETTVMVTELRCDEPGCPPLETVIAIMQPGQSTRQHKIHKPVVEVTLSDIEELAAG